MSEEKPRVEVLNDIAAEIQAGKVPEYKPETAPDFDEPEASDASEDSEPSTAPESVQEPTEEPDEEEAQPEEKPAPGKAEEAPEPQVAKSLAALARKEAMLRQKEQAFAEKERQYANQQAWISNLRDQALNDPVAFYKSLGVEKTADIAAHLYYEEMGEKAPKEFQVKKEQTLLQRKMQELEAKLAAKEQAEARAYQEANAKAFLLSYQKDIPDSLSYVKAEVKDNPLDVNDELYRRTIDMGSKGLLYGLSDAEIARAVAEAYDADLKRQAMRFKKFYQTSETPPASAKTAAPVVKKQLGNSTTATTKPRAEKPLSKWEMAEAIASEIKSGRHRK